MVSGATLWWCWEPPPSASPPAPFGLWKEREGAVLTRARALPHPAFPPSHPLPFSPLHLSFLLVSTLSSGCTSVHTHWAHQHRCAGWPHRQGVPGTRSLVCPRRLALYSHALPPPSCTATGSIFCSSPGWQHPWHPPCPAGSDRSQEPQPWLLALWASLGPVWEPIFFPVPWGAGEIRRGAPRDLRVSSTGVVVMCAQALPAKEMLRHWLVASSRLFSLSKPRPLVC